MGCLTILPGVPNEISHLIDGAAFTTKVNHRMAVGAHGSQVGNWVHGVLPLDFSKWNDVMDMDEAVRHWTVKCAKIEPTHDTTRPVVLNAGSPRDRIAFECMDGNPMRPSFEHGSLQSALFSQKGAIARHPLEALERFSHFWERKVSSERARLGQTRRDTVWHKLAQ